jgi:hypothetical protein
MFDIISHFRYGTDNFMTGDKGILGDIPLIIKHGQVAVTYTAEFNMNLYLVGSKLN